MTQVSYNYTFPHLMRQSFLLIRFLMYFLCSPPLRKIVSWPSRTFSVGYFLAISSR